MFDEIMGLTNFFNSKNNIVETFLRYLNKIFIYTIYYINCLYELPNSQNDIGHGVDTYFRNVSMIYLITRAILNFIL